MKSVKLGDAVALRHKPDGALEIVRLATESH